eukprot:Phypoly_transcript_15689.p1 GENE.Phypoly_transcript_15689~~Phypoly_transcript_15689.p1  ORF type:complete len:256 (+),score=25.64 Phypoly_transcript_15689:41-769(+)
MNHPDLNSTNYYAYVSSHHKLGKACSGLVILTKFPIRQAHQIRFKEEGAGTDRAARKGFLCVELDVGGYPIYVTNTHLQAGFDKFPLWWPFLIEGNPEKTAARVRARQLQELSEHIFRAAQEHKTGSFFICGDLNVKAGSEEYERMMEIMNHPSDVIHEYSDPDADLNTTESGRVDYIFSFHNHNKLLRDKRTVYISHAGVEHVRQKRVSDHSGIVVSLSLGIFEPCHNATGTGTGTGTAIA